MNKKYYQELKTDISKLISEGKYDTALRIINEELSMPYIPMEFEKFLLLNLSVIPFESDKENYSLSLEKVIDLLIKLDNSNEEFIELINQLRKFNLNEEREEIEFYFSKSKNENNRVRFFNILCEQDVNIELEYGNPMNITPIRKNKSFLNDRNELIRKLEKFPSLVDSGLILLENIYLSVHVENNINGQYSDLVIYTLGKFFNQDELKLLVSDHKKLKTMLENFKSIDNL